MADFFAETFGTPADWTCPDCGAEFRIYPGLPFDHVCTPSNMPPPRVAHYFCRLRDDDYVAEFCVANHGDPNQTVKTMAPDGTKQLWDRREEGDLLIFRPPDGYAGVQGLEWAYDRRLQRHEAAPREVIEREAMRGRISCCGGVPTP